MATIKLMEWNVAWMDDLFAGVSVPGALHAGVRCGGHQRTELERLCRYNGENRQSATGRE
jgi:hypothetical protein